MDYEEIMKVRRLEKNAARLVKVEKDFYELVGKYVAKEMASNTANFSLSKARELENLRNVVMDIYNMREKKILSQALVASRAGSAETEHMTTLELELYDSLVDFLSRYRGNVQTYFEPERQKAKGEKTEDLNKVALLILEEVPAFVGENMKEYGPFKANAEVELPQSVANLLVSRKLAKQV